MLASIKCLNLFSRECIIVMPLTKTNLHVIRGDKILVDSFSGQKASMAEMDEQIGI